MLMKQYLSLFILSAFLFGTFPLSAQTLDGSFSCQGKELVGTGDVRVTAIAGQSFEGTKAGSPLSYGFIESVSTANEFTNITAFVLSQREAALEVGEQLELSVAFSPEEVDNASVVWSSSDPEVATVQDGVVSVLEAGEATICAVSACGVYADQCVITVTKSEPDPEPEPEPEPEPILVTGVSLEPEEATLEIGETLELEATVLPRDADDKRVEWDSSDELVATVRDGVVTAVGSGTATIRVATVDGGYEATCTVTVTEDPTSIEEVTDGNRISFVDGFLYLELQKPQTVSVWNVNGQICTLIEGQPGLNVRSLQTYPAGVYFVRTESRVVKIVKR